MLRALPAALLALLAMAVEPLLPGHGDAAAQSNDNDYTPLNSRIRRDQQFPTEPRNIFDRRQLSDMAKRRSRSMVDQMANCLWDRSNEKAYDLLGRTDFGFRSFEQIGIANNEIGDYYPIDTCLYRVARTAGSGVRITYNAPSIRRWYIKGAYLDIYEDGPSWIRPGYTIADREYPLSPLDGYVRTVIDFADCVVLEDPHSADYFYRTEQASEQEAAAIQQLMPALDPCVPQNQRMEVDAGNLRIWIGEALWHASRNSIRATQDTEPQEGP